MNRTEILKIAKPIFFNTAMVRAILDGRKTVTRRVIKPNFNHYDTNIKFRCWFDGHARFESDNHSALCDRIPPYKAGDILYVRETSMIQSMKAFGKKVKMLFKADDKLLQFNVSDEEYERLSKWGLSNKWLSPYWITKETARIFLKVTDVRVERLQEITEDQAEKEGAYKSFDIGEVHSIKEKGYYKSGFSQIWDSTVDKKRIDESAWNLNPWVWVFEFERMEVNHE